MKTNVWDTTVFASFIIAVNMLHTYLPFQMDVRATVAELFAKTENGPGGKMTTDDAGSTSGDTRRPTSAPEREVQPRGKLAVSGLLLVFFVILPCVFQ